MRVFIDTNIPMYVAGRDHQFKGPSTEFLSKVESGVIEACTSAEVLQEILHRYTAEKRPEAARLVYEMFVSVCDDVLEVTLADTDRALELLQSVRGISARDALHAAVMLNHGISHIASFDEGFDAIPGIERLRLS